MSAETVNNPSMSVDFGHYTLALTRFDGGLRRAQLMRRGNRFLVQTVCSAMGRLVAVTKWTHADGSRSTDLRIDDASIDLTPVAAEKVAEFFGVPVEARQL